jgi:predicted metal-binding membrane protein
MDLSGRALSGVERLVRRDRLIVALGLGVLTALAWIDLVRMGGSVSAMATESEMHAAMGMPEMAEWGVSALLSLFVMWTVMMAGMMLPSAAPVILLVVGAYRRRNTPAARLMTAAFTGGYLVAWTGFSLAAASLQFALHHAALLSPAMAARSAVLGGSILVIGGIYQWLPIKNACLTHCRSPLGFLAHEWREGIAGALTMGVRHGLFCVGCCWALMALLLFTGVMNLLWVAVIAAFVLIEKLARGGQQIGRVGGVLLVAWGAWVML